MPKKGNSTKRGGNNPSSHVASTVSIKTTVKATNKNKADALHVISDDDSHEHDTASIVSSASESRSVLEEGAEGDERTQIEILEEKLRELIDLTTQKSSQGRINSFLGICKALSCKYMPDFVSGCQMTLLDCAERGLKKGKGAEQEAAAKLVALLCLQLGTVADSESIFREQKAHLLTLMVDGSVHPGARAQICATIGFCTFLGDSELNEIKDVMVALETVYNASLRSVEGGSTVSQEVLRMYSAALSSWSLLLTLLPPRCVYEMSQSHVRRLVQLLECSDVDVRIGAGEAIALIYEVARQFDENFGFCISTDEEETRNDVYTDSTVRSRQDEDLEELCAKLKQLATDSHKYRAKKDRKQQRSSFRDILRGIEENEAPDIRVKFGKESLEIDSWATKQQYDNFCHLLGSGMNLHLAQNELLRDVFNLGSPLLDDGSSNVTKVKKVERHYLNMATFKARSIARGKNRDKRTAVL